MFAKNKVYIVFALLAVFLALPYIILGQDAYVTVFDTLDSEFMYLHLLKMNRLLFGFDGNTPIPNIMNGLPRSFIHSEFSIIRLLFYLFPSFWAYVVNGVIIRLVGFVGMYLLARDYLLKGCAGNTVLAFSVVFSLIPLYSVYGISISGQPLLVWAFLGLSRNPGKAVRWCIIALFPFYAHFALVGPFILVALALWGIYGLLKRNGTGVRYFAGVALLTLSFIAANFLTIKGYLSPGDYVSHRSEFLYHPYPFLNVLLDAAFVFIAGPLLASSFKAVPLFLYAFVAFFFMKIDVKTQKNIFAVTLAIGLIALFHGFYTDMCRWAEDMLGVTLTFRMSRFVFLIPLLWFILFAVTLRATVGKMKRPVILLFAAAQIFLIFVANKELSANYAKLLPGRRDNLCAQIAEYADMTHTMGNMERAMKGVSYRRFFSSELFDDIAQHIGKPKADYRVVSLGLLPAVAQYNGFYTLDSYQNNYPVSYKHQFRKIIAPELAKNPALRQNFDSWANKCYLHSDELEKTCYHMCVEGCADREIDLDINTEALRDMGGEYIFSAVRIRNAAALDLTAEKKFSHPDALWDIYLYRVNLPS